MIGPLIWLLTGTVSWVVCCVCATWDRQPFLNNLPILPVHICLGPFGFIPLFFILR